MPAHGTTLTAVEPGSSSSATVRPMHVSGDASTLIERSAFEDHNDVFAVIARAIVVRRPPTAVARSVSHRDNSVPTTAETPPVPPPGDFEVMRETALARVLDRTPKRRAPC